MSIQHVALGAVVVAGIAGVLVFLLGGQGESGPRDGTERRAEEPSEPPRLRGSTPPPVGPPTSSEAAAIADTGAPGENDLQAMADELVEVLDYRNAGVAGVEVLHEVDLLDDPSVGPGVRWKTLASGTTNVVGQVHLLIDRYRRRQPGEGENHRLRLVPPTEREDLHPTWRLWTPANHEIYRMERSHVVEGRVLDRNGEPVWQATVWIGDLPPRGYMATGPGRARTKTDPNGHFRFAGLPARADGRIEVWAVGPGEEPPESASEVRGAQSVALDARQVEIRLP